MTGSEAISVPLLESCHAHLSGLDWQVSLARAGVRHKNGGLEEQLTMLALELTHIEEELAATFVADRPFFGLPSGWWIVVPSIYGGLFLWAMRADDPVARIYRWCGSMFLLAMGAVAFLVRVWWPMRRARHAKEARRPVLTADRETRVHALLTVRDALIEQEKAVSV